MTKPTPTVPSVLVDMLGQEIRVGDLIAYPSQDGNRPSMRVARITEFTLSKSDYSPEVKIALEIEHTSGYGAIVGSKVYIAARQVRYIKIQEKS